MLEFLTNPEIWASFLTLTVLEIVLGIDNIIFLSIVTATLPAAQQPKARRIGLSLALIMRIVLLSMITWIAGMTVPLVTLFDHDVSLRDVVMGGGGLFLLYKGTTEVHSMVEGNHDQTHHGKKGKFFKVIMQIIILDLVFSLDSVITAIGMVNNLPVMIAAIVVAIFIMMFAAEPVSRFVHAHPSVKMLALSFIMLVGVALMAEGMHFHIPRGYLYFAIAFSLGVEILNLTVAKRAKASGGTR